MSAQPRRVAIRIAVVCLALLAIVHRPLWAQAPEPRPVTAVRLAPGETIRIDGRLDHPAWSRAPMFNDFVEKDPDNGAPPSHETRVRVLFDDHALYFGIDALDNEPQRIRDMLVRHDNVNRTQDFVVVYIDAVGSRQSAQWFRVNAAGSTADGMHTHADDNEDFSPDFDFDGAAHRHAGGYSVVMRIPFASLRYPDRPDGPWRMMVARRVPREQFHLIASAPIPREAPSFIANLQPLQGVVLPEKHQFLTLRPSLTLRRETERDATGATAARNRTDASLDAKWRPLPELVVDGTLNPDFSQLALDVPQLAGNSRFALYFPEKRPFFFESSDLLRAPTDALYTRSLTQPRWGLRATWRGAALAGTTFAIDDRGGGFTLLPGPFGTGFAEQPASKTVAARLRHDGDGLQWGGLVAARRYALDRGDNIVAGPDIGWQIDDAWRVRAQWLHSSTSALSDGAGGLARGATFDGDRAYLRVVRQTERSETSLVVDQSGKDFRHDTGFVNQAGVRFVEGHYGHAWRRIGWLNELWGNLTLSQTRDRASGDVVQQFVTPGVWMAGPHNSELTIEYRGHSQRRVAAGAPLLRENYWKANWTITPAPWIPFFEGGFSLGRLADMVDGVVRPGGKLNLGLRTRPLARLEFEPSFSVDWLDGGGVRHYRESAAQLLAVWHIDARQHLRAIAQRMSLERRDDAGALTERAAATVGSLTYSWRRSMGSVLYVGASRSNTGYPAAARGTEAFIKLQADIDEARGFW